MEEEGGESRLGVGVGGGGWCGWGGGGRLTRFARALLSGHLLSPASKEAEDVAASYQDLRVIPLAQAVSGPSSP